MNEFLIAFAPTDRLGVSIEQFFDGRVKRKCHVINFLWAVESDMSADTLSEQLAKALGPDLAFVVAPIAGEWVAHNGRSKASCFG